MDGDDPFNLTISNARTFVESASPYQVGSIVSMALLCFRDSPSRFSVPRRAPAALWFGRDPPHASSSST